MIVFPVVGFVVVHRVRVCVCVCCFVHVMYDAFHLYIFIVAGMVTYIPGEQSQ